jgi:hypothetical protein
MRVTNKQVNLTLEDLTLLRAKIELNKAKARDYERLEAYLVALGITSEEFWADFKKRDIYSFEQYILERRRPRDERKRGVDGFLLGMLRGYIEAIIWRKQDGILP